MIDIFTGIHWKKIFFLGTWGVLVDVMTLSENYWTWKIWQDCLRIQVETTNYTHIICSLEQMYHFSNKESKCPLHRRICFLSRIVALKLLETPWKIPFASPLIMVSSRCDGTRDYWICIILEADVGIWNFHICFPVKRLELFSLLKLLFLYFYFFFQEAQIFLEEEDEILNPAKEERNNLWGVVKVQLTIPEEVVINYLQGLLSGELHKRFRRIGMKDVILPLLVRLGNNLMGTVRHF